MIDLEKALNNPSSVFKLPMDVVLATDLSPSQKIKILENWEYEIRDIAVAEEENMQGEDTAKMFDDIRKAQHALNAVIDTEDTPPTKQGGQL